MTKSPFSAEQDTLQVGQAGGAFTLNRRRFLQLLATLPTLGFYSHAVNATPKGLSEPWLSVDAVQKQLFPMSENWLGAEQINALGYLQQKMQRPLVDPKDYDFLVKGVGWLNDFAQSSHQQQFADLSAEQKETLLQRIAQSQAGENWLGMILNNLVEALLSDPIYGGNPNGIGWKAMGQTPGYPLPTAQERYFELGYQRRQRDYQQRIKRTTKG
jgi:gluconate 2-dehydrogenase gamma chain